LKREDFKELFDEHFDALRNYVYYRSGDQELATDIAQESFMKLWEKQLTKSPKELIGLLYKMASDLFISKHRHQQVVQNFAMQIDRQQAGHSPEDELRYKELKGQYEKALHALPDNQRIVFLMSRMDELKYQEIADRLQLSVKSIEKRMSQALKHLRKALGN